MGFNKNEELNKEFVGCHCTEEYECRYHSPEESIVRDEERTAHDKTWDS